MDSVDREGLAGTTIRERVLHLRGGGVGKGTHRERVRVPDVARGADPRTDFTIVSPGPIVDSGASSGA